MSEDPYRVLQVEPHADQEAIRAAYRRLARLYHPDLNADPSAAARMRAINAAYAVLSDPRRRAAYDARRFLPQAATVTAAPPRAPVAPRTWQPSPPPPAHPATMVGQPPTRLQRTVDRIVAVVGVLLLIGIAFYTINVIPYADQQIQASRRPFASGPAATADPAATDHRLGTAVPDRLRQDDTLRRFPGAVLVAPAQLEPFASLAIVRIEGTGQGIARYAVYYGNLNTGAATISGLVGRAALDAAVPRVADCAADAGYCAGPVPGQSSGPPGLELFRSGDLVPSESPAFVTHRVCCNGVFWSVSWYEPRSNMTYTIDLSRSVAARFGGPSADGDVSAARAVAALAPQLVRLP
jgi:hypothetical protein